MRKPNLDDWYGDEGPEVCKFCGKPMCFSCYQSFDRMKDVDFLAWLTEQLECYCNGIGVYKENGEYYLHLIFEVPALKEEKINAALDANGRTERVKDGELEIKFKIKNLTK